MSYVQATRSPNEIVLLRARLHWIHYLPATVITITSLLLPPFDHAWVLYSTGILVFVYSWLVQFSTEIAITSLRLIYKRGLIRRQTVDLFHGNIESFGVEQTILGRLLGYGSLILHGSGGAETVISNIVDPTVFVRVLLQNGR